MKKTRKVMSMLLAAALVLSLGVFGVNQTAQAETAVIDGNDISEQLHLINANLDSLKQTDSQMTWYYTVTDLDHDGRLEFVAAAQHPTDRSTNLRVWEVSEDRTALTELALNKDPEESFPDILTDNTDTYHDTATDTWYYMCYDNVVLSPIELFTIKSAVNVKDGVIGYDSFAIEHTEVRNAYRNVSHMDTNGFPISPEQYNAAGNNAFAGMERSSTSFDWFTEDTAGTVARLTDSYMVFTGQKPQTEVFPVPKPEALQHDDAPTPTPVPVQTPQPKQQQSPAYLTITKNPTNENDRKVGGSATFVACANAFESLSWTFISPNGGEYSVASFYALFPNAKITGENSTTITIGNVAADMNNWGAYCTFYYRGQVASTSAAWIHVKNAPKPTPVTPSPVIPTPSPSGVFSGRVTDYNYSTVSIWVDDGYGWDDTVDRGICSISGDLYIGAPLKAYYDGIAAHGPIFTYVEIQGAEPKPEPVYGSMSGTASEGGGGYAINLSNGTQVFVDAWNCYVYGTFVNGSPCTVYYTDSPTAANIYSVEIYGDETTPEPEEEQGGWAGSNYYDNEPVIEDGGWAGSNYEEPAYEVQIFEEPVYEEPVYEAPAYEAPVFEAPAYEAPADDGGFVGPDGENG